MITDKTAQNSDTMKWLHCLLQCSNAFTLYNKYRYIQYTEKKKDSQNTPLLALTVSYWHILLDSCLFYKDTGQNFGCTAKLLAWTDRVEMHGFPVSERLVTAFFALQASAWIMMSLSRKPPESLILKIVTVIPSNLATDRERYFKCKNRTCGSAQKLATRAHRENPNKPIKVRYFFNSCCDL